MGKVWIDSETAEFASNMVGVDPSFESFEKMVARGETERFNRAIEEADEHVRLLNAAGYPTFNRAQRRRAAILYKKGLPP